MTNTPLNRWGTFLYLGCMPEIVNLSSQGINTGQRSVVHQLLTLFSWMLPHATRWLCQDAKIASSLWLARIPKVGHMAVGRANYECAACAPWRWFGTFVWAWRLFLGWHHRLQRKISPCQCCIACRRVMLCKATCPNRRWFPKAVWHLLMRLAKDLPSWKRFSGLGRVIQACILVGKRACLRKQHVQQRFIASFSWYHHHAHLLQQFFVCSFPSSLKGRRHNSTMMAYNRTAGLKYGVSSFQEWTRDIPSDNSVLRIIQDVTVTTFLHYTRIAKLMLKTFYVYKLVKSQSKLKARSWA